ncbi:11535_t:CDS:2 [Entrophospora sp. SA101]|nr:11535_t:CDS:2 [Entrophospora sp. SA101]
MKKIRSRGSFYGNCPQCNKPRTNLNFCINCQHNYHIENFDRWSSGNLKIDKLIRYTQVNSTHHDLLEWIEWDDIELIEYRDKGCFGEIHSAYWLSGPLSMWDRDLEYYNRHGPTKVAIKKIDNSQELSQEFVNKYYEDGNIYKFLDKSEGLLCWRDIVEIIWLIAGGLKCIHREKLCHGNFHCGNILIDNRGDLLDVAITDVGSGIRPFSDIAHDEKLANEIIVDGKRPKICENNFPKVFIDLMRRCWENDTKRRPTAKELFEITGRWVSDTCDNPSPNETSRQFDDAEDKKFMELEKTPFSQPKIHPLAIYTSRLLDFPGIRIKLICFKWTALKLAVDHQWGGVDSEDKQEWLIGEIVDYFEKNHKNADIEDLEMILTQVMMDEFDTLLEDDSAYQLSYAEGDYPLGYNYFKLKLKSAFIKKSELTDPLKIQETINHREYLLKWFDFPPYKLDY